MKWTFYKFLAAALILTGCGAGKDEINSKSTFQPVEVDFKTTRLIYPEKDLRLDILFQQNDLSEVHWLDTMAPAKGNHDFLAFKPINGAADHGLLWVNHEAKIADPLLGDGGGATVLEVFRDSKGGWKRIGNPKAVNFTTVGNTMSNCLGALTPWGTVITSEEIEPPSNLYFFKDSTKSILTDTSDVDSLPRWKSIGWMVEADMEKREAKRKLYAMGRFKHEGNYCMPDERTVYMMDDIGPGAFFKFVADQPRDLSEGQLFAFKMEGETGGEWIPLPRDRDSLAMAREVAFRHGATIFIRMEDIELGNDGLFYITETGKDSIDLGKAEKLGGRVAPWLERHHIGGGIYDDAYGRLLTFDPSTNSLKVLMEGGQSEEDSALHFSNPDNLALDLKRNQLVIHEDINGVNKGRNPEGTGHWVNEIYVLNLSLKNPGLDDLKRLAVIPNGAESTGGTWNSDFSTLFFNIQHPDEQNPSPFNRSTTVALSGWEK